MQKLILIVEKIVPNKCVESIYQLPKLSRKQGKDVFQTTTQKCGYGDIE